MNLTNCILLIIMYIIETIKCALGQYIVFKEKPRKIYAIVCGLMVFSILIKSGLITVLSIRLIMYLIVYVVMFVNTRGNLIRKLSVVLLMVCMIGCLDELVGVILKVFISDATEYYYNIRSLLESGISLTVLTLVFILLRNRKVNYERILAFIKKWVYIVFALIVFFQLLTISALSFLKGFISNIRFGIYINTISTSSFLCLGLLIILIAYIKSMNEKLEKVVDTERDLMNMQKKYYITLLEKEEDTRRYRHDMNNHLLCLMELAHAGKTELVSEYIDDLQEEMHHIKEKFYNTGNELLDIIFNYYFKSLVDVEVRVNGICKRNPEITNVDLCIIFSNLIQNAVEAVSEQTEKDKFIHVKIEQGKENIRFSIKNSTHRQRGMDSIEGKNRKNRTSKEDKKNHGFGLLNIKMAVERNDGIFEIHNSDQSFETVLFLKYKASFD